MLPAESDRTPRFYFALPRLLTRLAGGHSQQSERNWVEANVVGGAIHLIVFLFAAHQLLGGRTVWQQLLLVGPLLVTFCAFWIIYFYLGWLLLKLVRVRMPPDRAHGVLIAIITSAFAWQLLGAGGWLRALGFAWLVAAAANVSAAGLLALLQERTQ
jgi:hypothetical protein